MEYSAGSARQTHRKANTTLGFIMKFLEKNKEKECKGYDGTTIFEHAVVCLRVSLVQEMLEGEKVSNINELNEEGKAPLHMIEGITYEDNIIDTILQLIQILFVYGAYPNVRDKNGNTLLLLMSARGGTENEQVNIVKIIQLLINNGANVNEKNQNGETPLSMATFNGRQKTIECLKNHGVADTS